MDLASSVENFLTQKFAEDLNKLNLKHINDESEDINNFVDSVIRRQLEESILPGGSTVTLEDYDEWFSLMFTKYNVVLTGGTLDGLNTLTRTSDVEVTLYGRGYDIRFNIACNDIELYYDKYEVNNFLFKPTGSLRLTVKRVRMETRWSLQYNRRRGVYEGDVFDVVKIKGLDDVQLFVTGFGGFDFIINKLVGWAAYYFEDSIVDVIEEKISQYIPIRF
uniref:Uncharacterized protein n=1 Tax=Clastoptera arizonana TaxID=38151 RepID=A0A1B6CU89_9HEMI